MSFAPEPKERELTPEETILFDALQRGDAASVQSALENDANVNSRFTNDHNVDTTPLMMACQRGFDDSVRLLLDAGADARWRARFHGWSALHVACWEGHLSTVELLVNHDKELLKIEDHMKWTPLFFAIERRHFAIFQFLLSRGANVHATASTTGRTTLQLACIRGDLEVVRLLVDAGVESDAIAGQETALCTAVRSRKVEIVRFLLDRGVKVHLTGPDGITTLMRACQNGSVEIMRLLLAAGVNVNARDIYLETALHQAARRGRREVMHELIVKYNANMFSKDNRGRTSFDLAYLMTRSDTAHSLLEIYGSQMEQAGGRLALHDNLRLAKFSYPDDDEIRPPLISPLQIRLAFGTLTLEHWRFLLRHLDQELLRNRDNSGKLPIHVACQTNAPIEVLATLVELDSATLQMADHTGSLPLHEQCRGIGDFSSVRYLVEQGGIGTLAARDRRGLLPIHILCGSTNPPWRTVQYLIQSFPMAVSMRTNAGEYPFMMAACEPTRASLNVVYELIRANPDLAVPRSILYLTTSTTS